jgi:hypothetical protein
MYHVTEEVEAAFTFIFADNSLMVSEDHALPSLHGWRV